MATERQTRLYYLDAARAFALLLGVFFHASLSFMPMFIGWAVMDVSTSSLVAWFGLISHSFRMELFFLLAGFFTQMKLQQRGNRLFIKSRLLRLGLPFLLGWLILRPLIVAGWTSGSYSMRGDIEPLKGLQQGVADLMNFPENFLVGTHLWFLYYLLLVSECYILLRALLSSSPKFVAFTSHQTRKTLFLCHKWRLTWPLLLSLSALCLWFMPHWSVTTPDKSLWPDFPVLLLYGLCFTFGAILQKTPLLMTRFTQLTFGKIILCLVGCTGSILLVEYEMQTYQQYYLAIKSAFVLCYAAMMWSLVSLTLALCKTLLAQSNPYVSQLASASYWTYLLHLPVVVYLQIAIAELPWHWGIKWLTVSVIAIGVCLFSHKYLISGTKLDGFLNGK